MITELEISSIRTDGGTQVRASKVPAAVQDYAEAMREGAIFPPVVVFQNGSSLWLADGFHRLEAASLAGQHKIAADLRQGTLREALIYALASNSSHGLRMTNADKRKAVGMALDDAELSQWSDREIARWCGVTHPFVAKLREERVVTVTTPWIPEVDHQAIGCATKDGIGMLAYVVPYATRDGETNCWWWIVVCQVRDGDDRPGDVLWTKKPVPRDWILVTLERVGFPAKDAEWEYPIASDESDELDEDFATQKKWSWPHIAFQSRQEWIEKRWRCDAYAS